MDYIPFDKKDVDELLSAIGVNSIEDLFLDVPDELKVESLNLPGGLSEFDLLREMKSIASKNKIYKSSFLGAGIYYHYIPSTVEFITRRSEFYTSYTPYQAEASQGMLQAIYEYQTAITRLTRMDVSNASMYNGATALAEAALISTIITRKDKILVAKGLHPEYLEVLKTYCWAQEIQIEIIEIDEVLTKQSEDIAALIIQSPNFFGDIEDMDSIVKCVRINLPDSLVIHVMTDPTCLGILKPPGSCDVDIFVAEGQPLGISPSLGGPSLGIFTAKKKFLRKIPGRLVGKTKEINGDRTGYILTLQTREQHIRREKAISNICTNEALTALAALIYIMTLGEKGLSEVAKQNLQKAHYVKEKLNLIKGFQVLNQKPTYNEFIVKCPNIDEFFQICEQQGLLPPLKVSDYFAEMKDVALVCVTELNSVHDIELFLSIAEKISKED
ncbi:MAG: aminomethyl-transferring glycine dehydrogenase subunit GcvPA [Candidatus Lokiarchaeota archaeon]|nr:aminomethyl-transferring glycine dehydrogenase subunit GcvPA [Candidatus Lokiarchaeota archaeon]MBD3338095.1 aminomethyl-transferring glycine dehydrogenase subunit GcvPA [Candidatus Lokiarchaeota archaeon]